MGPQGRRWPKWKPRRDNSTDEATEENRKKKLHHGVKCIRKVRLRGTVRQRRLATLRPRVIEKKGRRWLLRRRRRAQLPPPPTSVPFPRKPLTPAPSRDARRRR